MSSFLDKAAKVANKVANNAAKAVMNGDVTKAVMNGVNAMQSLQSMGVKVYVATEKGSYRAGEIVSGKVWINSMVPIPLQAIRLKISGFESCTVIERRHVSEDEDIDAFRRKHGYNENRNYRGDDQGMHATHFQNSQMRLEKPNNTITINGSSSTSTSRIVYVPHHQQNQILNLDVVIANYSQYLGAGSYTFPFEFVLPEVPGTFIESGEKFEACINYSITAICEQFGGLGGQSLSHSQPLFVEEKLKHLITEQMVSDTLNVRFCCCFNKGTCTVSAVAAKNAVFPGDIQNVICDVQNESSCRIKTVNLSIKKDFRVYASGKSEYYSKRVVETKHKGLPVGYKDTKEFSVSIPHNITPTTNSTLIQSNYRLKVKLVMSGAGNVSIDMPLTVYPMQQQIIYQPPQNWNVDPNQMTINQKFVFPAPSAPMM